MSSAFSAHVATGKDLLSLARDGLIFFLVLLLLFFPAALKKRLVEAGIREGEFMGLKWNAEDVIKTDSALTVAQATIASLSEQLKESNSLLAQARTELSGTRLSTQLAQQVENNQDSLKVAVRKGGAILYRLNANQPKVMEARRMVSLERAGN